MSKSAQPIAKKIAQELERLIIEGVHHSSVPLRQADLAVAFGVSHIPVREALAMLAEKGLVQIIPNRGAMVVPLSASQCMELSGMRAALEVIALRHSIPRLSDSNLVAAQLALTWGRRAPSLSVRAQCNWDFHRALYTGGEQPFLMNQLETLWRHADRYLMFAWTHAEYEARSDDEHESILKACSARDVRLACQLTRQHIQAAARSVERLLTAVTSEISTRLPQKPDRQIWPGHRPATLTQLPPEYGS